MHTPPMDDMVCLSQGVIQTSTVSELVRCVHGRKLHCPRGQIAILNRVQGVGLLPSCPKGVWKSCYQKEVYAY